MATEIQVHPDDKAGCEQLSDRLSMLYKLALVDKLLKQGQRSRRSTTRKGYVRPYPN